MNIVGKNFAERIKMLRQQPGALRGWMPHLKNYKMTVRELAKYIFSIFGGDRSPEPAPRLLALAWYYYLQERSEADPEDYKSFMVMLEIDVVEAMEGIVNNYLANLRKKEASSRKRD